MHESVSFFVISFNVVFPEKEFFLTSKKSKPFGREERKIRERTST